MPNYLIKCIEYADFPQQFTIVVGSFGKEQVTILDLNVELYSVLRSYEL